MANTIRCRRGRKFPHIHPFPNLTPRPQSNSPLMTCHGAEPDKDDLSFENKSDKGFNTEILGW
ncbi:hypothetical protein BD779DRAFT_1560112 [Infundibulicybe gibba]|nr:hypothetical protein BD779DRAFT_1560112 [Infundibulicybe gibba]